MKKKAFSLIELLVVIAIIGTLTTLAVFSINNLRAKSRDTKRVADIKKIQLVLENYYRDESAYPNTMSFGGNLIGTKSSTSYMAPTPQNPLPWNDGDCPNSDYSYQTSTKYGYKIQFCLNASSSDILPGINCATPKGIITGQCLED